MYQKIILLFLSYLASCCVESQCYSRTQLSTRNSSFFLSPSGFILFAVSSTQADSPESFHPCLRGSRSLNALNLHLLLHYGILSSERARPL